MDRQTRFPRKPLATGALTPPRHHIPRRGRGARAFLGCVLLSLQAGCTYKQFAARATAPIIEEAFAAFQEEGDLALAEAAAASNLKLLEGLLRGDPNNRDLLLMAARGFGGYAFAFVEEKDPERAGRLYLRGRDYGMRLLRKHEFVPPASFQEFRQAVRRLDKEVVPALFWTAYNWANWANLNQTSPRALADLPRAVAMMERVLDLDEKYFHGGAHVFFGAYLGGRPKIAGGDVQAAKRHFDRAVEISEGKFLPNWVFYARYYAVPTQDREMYIMLLRKVTRAPADVLPAERLANTVARTRAARMLDDVDEYF